MILLENLILFSVLCYCSMISFVFYKKYLIAFIYFLASLFLYVFFIFGLYHEIFFYFLLSLFSVLFVGLSLFFYFSLYRQTTKKYNRAIKMYSILILSFLLPGVGHFILNMKKTGSLLILFTILYFFNINSNAAVYRLFVFIKILASIDCWMYLFYERKTGFYKICLHNLFYLSLMFIFGYLNLFITQNFIKISIITSSSMSPTIKTNDIIVTKRINSNYQLKNNDIILFELPGRVSRPEGGFSIKRIIGKAGDSIRYDGLGLYINEQLMLTKDQQPEKLRNLDKVLTCTLSKDTYFIVGDNYFDSFDSRYFGPIPRSSIYGKVIQKIWPINESCSFCIRYGGKFDTENGK